MIRAIQLVIFIVCLVQALHGQAAPSCAPLSGEQILGRDLAAAVPALAAVRPDISFGYSPVPGVQRVYQVSELQKVADRFGISTRIASPVCFAWPLHSLTREAIITALRNTLSGKDVDVEVTDQCRMPVPDGEIVFPMGGLSAQSAHSELWNGYISYGAGKHFAIWAKVTVTVHEKQIVAAHDIRQGELIQPADIGIATYSGPLRRLNVLQQTQEVIGKCAARPLIAGSVLTEAMLVLPQDVDKQQLVTVHVQFGASHLETQGIAIEGGRRGDVIKVRNPKTGRVFLARINDSGVVTVVPGGDVGLVAADKKS
jgi:flagella basal body P-ring formation protein FlgA